MGIEFQTLHWTCGGVLTVTGWAIALRCLSPAVSCRVRAACPLLELHTCEIHAGYDGTRWAGYATQRGEGGKEEEGIVPYSYQISISGRSHRAVLRDQARDSGTLLFLRGVVLA
jgi:hypothetical protein